MRFICDSCRAQYMISDEKVGPKGVKVRCKKCGYVILVKKAEGGVAMSPTPAPVPLDDDGGATQLVSFVPGAFPNAPFDDPAAALKNALDEPTGPGESSPKGGGLLDASEDEIGAVFDSVLNSGTHTVPKAVRDASDGEPTQRGLDDEDDHLATRVLDAEVVKKLAEKSGSSAEANGNGHAPSDAQEVPKTDWYVAIDDKQTGPLTLDRLKEHWEAGEISPDSLCWRAGFSDWIPVREVADLAAEFAPRPNRPVMVAPVTVGSSPAAPVVTIPVESAFSAGGLSAQVQSEMPVALGSTGPDDTGSWRPSAASALASLVKDEMEVLAKPKPKTETAFPIPSAGGGLLSDLPESSGVISKPAKAVNGLSAPKVSTTPEHEPGELTGAHGPRNPYIAAAVASSANPYQAQPHQNKTVLYAILAASVVAVLGIGAFVVVSLNKPSAGNMGVPQPTPAPVAANPTPANVPPPTAAPAPTTAAPTAPQAAANPQGAAANPPAANPPPGAAVAPPPANAAAVPAPQVAGTVPAPNVGGSKVPSPKGTGQSRPKTSNDSAPKEVAAAPAKSGGAEVDDFEKEFGGGGSKSTKKEDKKSDDSSGKKPSSVYVPPAPGAGGNIPESLSQSDVMEVVKGNVPAIKKCVDEYKAKEPSAKGRMSMRWQILTSGKVSKVECVTDEYKSTPLATCLSSVIKSWQFPRHKSQGDPTVFPFTF